MRRWLLGAVAGLSLVVAGGSAAQEPEDEEPARREVRVLRDPYDLASFYRGGDGSGGAAFLPPEAARRDPYRLSGFYRSGGPRSRPAFGTRWWTAPRDLRFARPLDEPAPRRAVLREEP